MNLGEDYRIDSILTQIMPCIQVQPIYISYQYYICIFLSNWYQMPVNMSKLLLLQ